MTSKIKSDDDTADADAAVAEISEPTVDVPFNEKTYSFKRKRLGATQFRLQMQKNNDLVALEWLLGRAQFALLMESNSDKDGCMLRGTMTDFFVAIGDAVGAGNS